jgi:co-chaperonin GroES (HSP10)
MPTTHRPLNNWIIIRPIIEKRTESGLHLPEGYENRDTSGEIPRAEVVAVHKFADVEPGDIIRFFTRHGLKLTVETDEIEPGTLRRKTEELAIITDEALVCVEEKGCA